MFIEKVYNQNIRYSKAIMEEVDMLEEILEKNYKQQLSHNTFKGGSQKPKKKKPTKSLTNDNSSEVMQTKSSSVSKSSSIISSSSTSLASKNSKPSPSSSTQSYPKSSNTSS
ncbi:uncharacterized protein LOC135930038 isoform X2 [Gordionus sp. m RMFG-2023]|uniref:uncharacterized protein LOC135930038 isoform X2 n=1 Tax=Gordionus sp. m RMFG-2023 TaxID=3053472 RepID=UPI0031FDC002